LGNKPYLEEMVKFNYLRKYFQGKKVFLTGHTGFKGSWMLQILSLLGAEVKGYSLAPEKSNDLYYLIDGDSLCKSSVIHDIRDAETLRRELVRFEPDFVFHLAAQPLVLKGYEEPLYTFEVNGQGTANSKAVSEIIISSYRSSFFNPTHYAQHQKTIASVRAGNVIGGGDFAANRIIPDIIRSIQKNETIQLRNPHATRPWQHVLEPLGAYLLLATKMVDDPIKFNTAYNIGPEKEDVLSVEELTKIAVQIARQGNIQNIENTQKPHEAATLMLDIHKVKTMLGWHPRLNAKTAIQKTVEWYMDNASADNKCLLQIKEYFLDTIDDAIDS
jgi:CDP-glucose 4,6-dehydratase